MLYDIRTYHLKPGALPAYMAAVRDHAKPIRERHGVQLAGWYHYEVDGAPCVVHIWAYRDAAHVEGGKHAFRADPEWIEQYQPKVRDLLVSTSNHIAEAAPFAPQAVTP